MEKTLNDGKCHTIDEIKNSGMAKSAKEFSEGDKNLESILLNLWEMGIETVACCIGRNEENHPEDDSIFKIPYLTIKIDEQNYSKVITLIKHIMQNNDFCKPNIYFRRYDYDFTTNSNHSSSITLERIFLTKQSAKKMFSCILKCVEDLKNNKPLKEETSSASLEMIEELSQSMIINPFVQKCEIKINHNNQSTFSFGSTQKKKFSCKLNEKTLNSVKYHCSRFTTPLYKHENEL